MEINIEKFERVTIICPLGRLDTTNYMRAEDKLLAEIREGTSVLIDCQQLDYISSSGLRVLLVVLKQSEKVRVKLALCSLQPAIMDIFQISAFDKILKIYENRDVAMIEMSR